MATVKEKRRDALQISFGEVLRRAREEKELSQQELAFESELDRTYISLLERGLRQPTLATLLSLASALNVEGAELVRRAEAHPGYRKARSGI